MDKIKEAVKMKISDKDLNLIKSFEDYHLTAYICPSGKPTIGYKKKKSGI